MTTGRARTPGDIEALACRMAQENMWGYKSTHGELKKLGIQLSESYIADILRTWREFLAPRRGLERRQVTAELPVPPSPWVTLGTAL